MQKKLPLGRGDPAAAGEGFCRLMIKFGLLKMNSLKTGNSKPPMFPPYEEGRVWF